MWLPAGLGIILIIAPNIYPHLNKKLQISILVAVTVFITAFVAMLSIMWAEAHRPTNENAGTVIVLGCEVTGQEPSQLLKCRLNTAKQYLDLHPKTICIVTGGLGDAATITEAECMKKYLVEYGIAENRIYTENASADTRENIQNTKHIIQENGLDTNVVIITDAFHECRALLYAARYGLSATPHASYAPYILQQSYWIRDMLGIVKYFIT